VNADRLPLGARLAWCFRTYAWLVIACVLGVAAVPLFLAPAEPTYEATALVVTRDLGLDREVLPRLGAAVFNAGPVASFVAEEADLADGTDGLVPEKVSVVAAEDSVVFIVQARDPDPPTAARLADLAGVAFVEELNRGGTGEFALQAEAIVPSRPLAELDPQLRVAFGAAVGAVLGVALVALIAALRRPVVTSRDVEGAVGVPLLGTLRLPRVAAGTYAHPRQVPGIAAMTRRLAMVRAGRLLLISGPSAAAIRHYVYLLTAEGLATLRPLRLEAPRQVIDAVEARRSELPDERRATARRPTGGGELVLVDSGGSLSEIVDPASTRLSAIAVAPRGVSRRRLRLLAADYLGGELIGVVLVDVGTGFRRRTGGPARTAVRASQTFPTTRSRLRAVRRVGDVPAPEAT
jgi:hypothetical protein